MKYLKQLGFNALFGMIVGGIVDLIFAMIDRKRNRWNCTFVKDTEYIKSVPIWYFDFDKRLMVNAADHDDVLIDFNSSPKPEKEMTRMIDLFYK